ncbi:hypothetical protein H0H93_011958, partial [Arthromyces matolae]
MAPNWLENYAESMELNVIVRIARGGSERTFTVKHVVFATGLGSNDGVYPTYPGM